jgi:hypothetical protein
MNFWKRCLFLKSWRVKYSPAAARAAVLSRSRALSRSDHGAFVYRGCFNGHYAAYCRIEKLVPNTTDILSLARKWVQDGCCKPDLENPAISN